MSSFDGSIKGDDDIVIPSEFNNINEKSDISINLTNNRFLFGMSPIKATTFGAIGGFI